MCAESWRELTDVPPSVFGFAVAVHPADPRTAWFVPGIKDECRVPVDARLVVTRTRDGGESFDVLSDGLPQDHCYDIVFRHGMDVDATGERLAIGSSTGGLWISENGGDSWNEVAVHLPQIYSVRFAAIGANLLHRRFLGAFFSRGLFSDPRDKPPFYDVSGFPIHHIRLTSKNFRDAIIASGSIPMVMQGVRDIHGAPPGTYRDGGVIDYHFDIPTVDEDRISLFPHFFDWLKPGWFDRKLAWRKVNPKHMDRTLLICPSPEFIARLPDGKVPDRTDFVRMPENRRIRLWWEVVKACEELAEELNDVLDKDQLATRLESLC